MVLRVLATNLNIIK